MPSALPRSKAAVTVSKLPAISEAGAASPSPSSKVEPCSAASLASASLTGLLPAPEDPSSDTISGAASGTTFWATLLIVGGGPSGDPVCKPAFLPSSAGIKSLSFLPVAGP